MTHSLRTRFDAIVVGAGLSGSTAAIQLARGGWRVALVERQPFPRRKVCGECIAASNLPLLQSLGVGEAFFALAGPELRRVRLMHGGDVVAAELPPAEAGRPAWGRALGRDTLDSLLLEQARSAGATVFQPWAVQSLQRAHGGWHADLRAPTSGAITSLHGQVVVDAHGSWEDLPTDRSERRLARGAADLFAFKANFATTALPPGEISVLALDGGYGGMVVADGGMTTVACCIRRDRLSRLRLASPRLRAGDAVEAWLQRECSGVAAALQGAARSGPWLTSGPLDPGVRVHEDDGIFRIGNAAGEAHPILGEGMSMALQSAALLSSMLLRASSDAALPNDAEQAALHKAYAAAWSKAFVPRMRLAAVFAHAAMRPGSATLLMKLVRTWPGLLTAGARWGGKLELAEPLRSPSRRPAAEAAGVLAPALPGAHRAAEHPPR